MDFTYEVSRSFAACEGAILVVDATQGVEAQTLANVYLALDHNLEILPVINKIDLPSARPEEAAKEIEDVIGLDCSHAPRISAKEGIGIKEVLDAGRLPSPPKGDEEGPLKALIFDSYYDNYKGAISYVRLMDGNAALGMAVRFMAGMEYELTEVGIFTPFMRPVAELKAGDVGYIAASVKTVADTRVGDTVTGAERPASHSLPGLQESEPGGVLRHLSRGRGGLRQLKDALEKLQLNDASLSFEPETSAALGFGFRCGFLGLLHMEIIQQRIEREFDLNLVTTAPSVSYHVKKLDGETLMVENPSDMPDPAGIEYMEEPIAAVSSCRPTSTSAPSWRSARTSGASSSTWSTSRAPGW